MNTQEKIAIMQAYLDGKQIQQQRINQNNDWKNCYIEPCWDWHNIEYRITPEQKLRPYNSAKEFVEAMREHGPMVSLKSSCLYSIPIETTTGQNIVLNNDYRLTLQEAFDNLVWQDGTPCGIMDTK